MSQTFFARRHSRGLTYVALGMAFILSVPPNSYARQDAAPAQDPKAVHVEEVSEAAEIEAAVAAEPAVAPAAEPLAIVGTSPRCAEAANSPLAEPEWFLDECLGGVRPTSPGDPAAAAENMVPGDLFYLHNIRGAGTPPFSLYTAPIPTYTFTTLGTNNLPIFAVDFDLPATTLWGINNTTRGLGTYNLTTGAFTQTVVTTGIPAAETISGLKFDPTSSTVYVNSTVNLYTINLTTGVCTLVGPFTHAAPAIIEIAINATGQMFGEDITTDSLYSINKATGATTLIGPLGVNISFAQGMDFDWSDGTLYQYAYIGGGVNDLRTINTTTGATTLVLNGPVGPEHEGATKVAFAPPGPTVSFIDEVEPNDTPAAAQALSGTPMRIRGLLFKQPFVAGQTDADVYSFSAPAGSRLYAGVMGGFDAGVNNGNTTLDVIAPDGTTVLETDDNDGAIAPNSSNVGGTLLAAGGTYYVRVRQTITTGIAGTIRPYDVYIAVATGAPTAEVEPNNNGQTPNPLPLNRWVSGAISVAADNDTFGFTANAGDTIVALLDVDPERDAPDWNARFGIAAFNNFILVVDGAPAAGDGSPSEALFMTTKTTGPHYVYIDEPAGAGGAAFTYNLYVAVIPAKARTCTTYTGTTGPITDAGSTDFTVAVPDARIVDYLRVGLNANHTLPADLDVTLISPDGNEVFLFDDLGNAAGGTQPLFNLVLEDEGGIPVGSFNVHSGTHYSPEGAAAGVTNGRLEYFKGMQAQGTWTLRVRDDLATNTGTVNSWSIDVCEPAPRPSCAVPGPQENTVYASDFEANDGGFTHSGAADEWERGLPTFAPITTAHSGTNAWKTDLDNTYDINANNNLLSPNINLTSVTGRVTLSWWQKFQLERIDFDHYWVEVRTVGATVGQRVFDWTGTNMNRSLGTPAVAMNGAAGWGRVQADISSFVGQNVEVVFHIDTDNSVQFAGVGIDDVLVTSCTTIGQAAADLSITKTDNQSTYFPGQQLTYTIVASNAGPSTVLDATVADAFPADLTNVTWTCVASAGSACGVAGGTGDINDTVDLIPSGTVTYTAIATVAAGATGPIANSASITGPGNVPDPNTANNNATDTDQLLLTTPFGLAVDTAGNNVYQPNETVVVAPTWTNQGTAAATLTGTFANHTGPAGPTYTIPDASADYGSVAGGANGSCSATGDCYSVANTAATRPSTHWDTTVEETISPLSGSPKTWTLHVGNSFTDVPPSNPFFRFIEILLHRPITGGCTQTAYCPSNSTTREQMAVFVLLSKEAPGYVPPACVAGSEAFNDVPATSPFCRWIEELARRGVVGGCGNGAYCPTNPVTREQMSIFVLKTLDPALVPPACAPPNLYNDVPETSPFCRWIEELTNRSVVSGCGGGNYCPSQAVTREQMGVFLAVTFSLSLYGL
jgi:uncharacterized repeat protein (TIGR01451 family)